MKATKPSPRRKFLLAAGLGGAGVAAAVVVTGPKPANETATVADTGEKSTATVYRASPHVLKYYKTTEV
jgi:hypothetical protein